MNKTMITAHSGCEGTPDNSLASIRAGIAAGADCVEVDVHIAPDDKLYLTHDTPADYSGLASLEEAFAIIKAACVGINCDLKDYRAFSPALRLAADMRIPREQLFFSGSVNARSLAADPSPARRARILLNSEELCLLLDPTVTDRQGHTALIDSRLDEAAAFLRENSVEALNAPYRYLSPEQIAHWQAAGLPLSLWTINDPQHLAALMEKGLSNLTTRIPSEAIRIRTSLLGGNAP